jgi:Tol biopolymer transport system component
MDRNGANLHQVTHFGHANWAPFWTHDGKSIIFASNMKDPAERNFDLFLINLDGTGLEQVTFNPTFDGFPMFSPDGNKIVFASNRNDRSGTETNIFVGDWVR